MCITWNQYLLCILTGKLPLEAWCQIRHITEGWGQVPVGLWAGRLSFQLQLISLNFTPSTEEEALSEISWCAVWLEGQPADLWNSTLMWLDVSSPWKHKKRREEVNGTDSPSRHWLSAPLWEMFADREKKNGTATQYQPKFKSHSIPTYHGEMFPDTTCWFKTFPTATAAARQRSTTGRKTDGGRRNRRTWRRRGAG